MQSIFRQFWAGQRGAVAPLIAISLFALVAAGGIAFDYARMATLDTELQNAADQAALAAATQLDGSVDSMAKAEAAARNLLANNTVMGNDGGGLAAQIATSAVPSQCTGGGAPATAPPVEFFANKTDAESGCNGFTDTARYAEAKFVRVAIAAREAVFALTPIVAAFRSGDVHAEATAGMGSAICNVPPLMMCNPDEPAGNPDKFYDFDLTNRVGIGIKLIGDGSYAPGNFGFLETGFGNGANDLLKALGYDSPPGDCMMLDGVNTKPGMNASVMDGINTRFDVPGNGTYCPGDGTCSPSANVRKDLVRGSSSCNWEEADGNASQMAGATPPRYRPTSAALLPTTTTPEIMGHPRDLCHAHGDAGSCTNGSAGRMGNGEWDRAAYFRSNHPSVTYSSVASAIDALGNGDGKVSRYETYLWELQDPATRLGSKSHGSKAAYGQPQPGMCLGVNGITPGGTNVDRRRISAAVINCDAQDVGGSSTNLTVVKWLDLFLVEPSMERKYCKNGGGGGGGGGGKGKDKEEETEDDPACNNVYSDKKDVYVEVIGETEVGAQGSTAGQVTRRDVPYLVK